MSKSEGVRLTYVVEFEQRPESREGSGSSDSVLSTVC